MGGAKEAMMKVGIYRSLCRQSCVDACIFSISVLNLSVEKKVVLVAIVSLTTVYLTECIFIFT